MPPSQEPSPTPPGSPARSLRQAVLTALVLLGLIIACALGGRRWFFALAATVVLMAMFELLDALVQKGRRPSIPLGLAATFAVLLVAYQEKFAYFAIVLAVTTYLALVFALRPGRGPTPGSDAAWTIFGLA
ncbi:MAG TPA: phosphatidate cytidylyltransferase, partial [Actinomycetota bacterium]|nr:phosphatidate cytidylyltransferase [Actinomycetota bacterium]